MQRDTASTTNDPARLPALLTADRPGESPVDAADSALRGLVRRLQGPALAAMLAAVNHLLGQHAWARHKLATHAGKEARFALDGPMFGITAPDLHARISPEGFLVKADPAAASVGEPALSLLLKPSVEAVFAAVRDGAQGLSGHLRVEGDVALATTLGELVQQVRWDPEEDLSRVVGDAAAHRIGRMAGQAKDFADDLRRRLERTAVSFLTVEQPQLVSRVMVDGFGAQVSALAERIEALERRLDRLERPSGSLAG